MSAIMTLLRGRDSFQDAFEEARGRPGMGSLRFSISFDPYECDWVYEAEINFADNSRYKDKSTDPDECLNNVAEQVRAIPIQWEKLV